MLNIITSFLDALFPPRESERLVRSVTATLSTAFLKPGTHKQIPYLCRYQDPLIRALITENKYHQRSKAADILATLLQKYLTDTTQHVLIPIPLHPLRERERGYNQVTVILNRTSHRIEDSVLVRTKHTSTQTQLNKEARQRNLHGAFSVHKNKLETYRHTHFIIVDDVLTTGATLEAGGAPLAPHLPPTCTLSCLALAH